MKMQDFSSLMEGFLRSLASSSTSTALTGPIIGILTYVLTGLALYTMADRRGIRNAWLAWIPVLKYWLLGSISDQYQYVVRGKVTNKRKVLLALGIVNSILMLAFIITSIVFIMRLVMFGGDADETIISFVIGYLMFLSVLLVLAIISTVFDCMALYDVFRSCDPDNAVLFLVLSILIRFVRPILLMVCKDKDGGMPPRRIETPPVM